MEKLLNCSFPMLALEHQGFQIVLQAVDQTLTSLWPSVESRLKMQQFTTVRVFTTSTVSMCSHSEKASYKNLPQSDWTETEVTAAAGSYCRDWYTSLRTHTHTHTQRISDVHCVSTSFPPEVQTVHLNKLKVSSAEENSSSEEVQSDQ